MAATDVSRTNENTEQQTDGRRSVDGGRAGLLARVPGIMYVLAALLVTSMGVSGAAGPAAVTSDFDGSEWAAAATEASDAATPDVARDGAGGGDGARVGLGADLTEETALHDAAAEAEQTFSWPPQTGQRLTPEQIEQAKAMFAELQSQGLHRGPGVIEAWEPIA